MNEVEQAIRTRIPERKNTSEALCKLIVVSVVLGLTKDKSVTDLAELLQCSERALYRNLSLLKDAGIVENCQGVPENLCGQRKRIFSCARTT